MVALADTSLGRGAYGFAEAGRLTRVSERTVRAWFHGRRLNGKPAGRGRIFSGDYSSGDSISFLDLIEVLVAGHLRKAGVSLARVRKVHAIIGRTLSTPHPFSHRELLTDGQRIFVRTATDAHEEQLLEGIQRQHFFPKVMLPYLKRVDYDPDSKLARAWHIADGVVIDPARMRGKPILDSSSVPVSVLAAAYDANDQDAAAVADWYGVTPKEVELAVNFSRQYSGAGG